MYKKSNEVARHFNMNDQDALKYSREMTGLLRFEEKNMAIAINVKEKVNVKEQIAKDKARDSQIVKGIFRNHETPGGVMSFVYKQYKGDPVQRYDLQDGEMYSLPRGVAKHLNNNLWYPVNKHAVDEKGKSIVTLGQKVRRCSFESMDFLDIEEPNMANDLVTVSPSVGK